MVVQLSGRSPAAMSDSDGEIAYRTPRRADIQGIGKLYFAAYEPGLVGESVEEAIADIEASWNGEYGDLWEEGSVIAEQDSRIIGTLLTVRRAPWDETPEGPFIIELFTDPGVRGGGVARELIERALDAMASQGAQSVGLRVLTDNTRAQSFYRSVGFVDWTPS